jgi:hypothetical protein
MKNNLKNRLLPKEQGGSLFKDFLDDRRFKNSCSLLLNEKKENNY